MTRQWWMTALVVCSLAGVAGGSFPVSAAMVAPSTSAVVGGLCGATSRASLDESRRPVSCSLTAVGRRWIWSSVIPAPVSEAAPLPPSWSAIVPDTTGLNADVPASPLPGRYPSRSAMEGRIVELVNAERAARGLAPVVVDWRLTKLARWWAEHYSDGGYAGRGTTHCPPDLCALRAAELGYLSYGEVIRPWSPFPQGDLSAERYFVDSPRHLAILTEPRITHIVFGVNIVMGPDGSPASVTVVGEVGRSKR